MTAKAYQAGLNGALIADNTITPAELSAGVSQGLTNNPVINGGFDIWQRGTAFGSIANGAYMADRWKYGVTGAAVHNVFQSTDVPAVAALVPITSYSLYLAVATADASIASNDISLIQQPIEGYNWAPFAQQQLTVGFWVKDTVTGIHCVSLRNAGSDRSCVIEYTVSAANTWEYKTCTFPASPSTGTWDYTNGVGAYLTFALSCGSTLQTTAGAWQTGAFFGTSSQVNCTSSVSNNFRLWGVTMGLGTTVAPFWPRSFGQELALCQRYYRKSYEYGTAPGAATSTGAHYLLSSDNTTTKIPSFPVEWSTPMRAAPTVSHWDHAGNATKITTMNAVGAETNNVTASVGLAGVGDSGFRMVHQGTIAGLSFQWAASAEL